MKNSFDLNPSKTVRWPQILAGLAAAGGAFAVGAALGWPAPAGPRLVEHRHEKFFPITDGEFSLIASIITIGCAISCLPIGILMKKFGRKWTMLGLVVPFLIGWGMVIKADSVRTMLIGRFVIGLAGGAFCVSAPQYSAEIAEKDVRGIVGTFFQLLIIAGILFAYIVGAFIEIYAASIMCAAVPLVFGLVFLFMPESPVYLVIEKRYEEAAESYRWLRGNSFDPTEEINSLKAELQENENNQNSLLTILKRKATIKAMAIGFGLMFFQQMSGINIVVFYATSIFKAANTTLDSDISTIIVGLVHLIATALGSLLVDKAGRRILLMISIVVMTIMLILLGVFFHVAERDSEAASLIGWLPLTSLCIYLIAFAIGYGPVPWLMLSEIYTKDYNAFASPLTGAFNWSLAFVITLTFGQISETIGIGVTFWGFAALSMAGTVFTFLVVPETKGLSMLEVQQILNGEKVCDKSQNIDKC